MIIIHRAVNGLVIEDTDELEKISAYQALEETSEEEADEYKFTRRALYAIAEALSLNFGSKHDVKLELCFMKDGVDIEEAKLRAEYGEFNEGSETHET